MERVDAYGFGEQGIRYTKQQRTTTSETRTRRNSKNGHVWISYELTSNLL